LGVVWEEIMRIAVHSFALAFAVGATLLAAAPNTARAAEPDTVGRMKRIILPPEGPTNTATKPSQPSQPRQASQPATPQPFQPPAQSNPVPDKVPVQSIIDRAMRTPGAGPFAPPGLQ
jgi:hypothetical protein